MKAEHLAMLAQRIGPVVREYVAGVLAEYVKRLDAIDARAPLPGRDGLPGVPGPPGERGDRGEKGLDGAAGRDGTVLGLKELAAAIRPLGEDGGRRITWVWADGSPVEGWVIKTAIPLDRGVYEEGRLYEKGDSVTYGGSFWIAQDIVDAKPKELSDRWRLAVKQGAPGKPGPAGVKGLDGKDGRHGRDLTQMDQQGQKW